MKSYTYKLMGIFLKIFQHLSVYAFSIFLVFSIGLGLTEKAQAETIITNTATASFSINGTNNSLSDSVQFTKNTEVAPSDEITLTKQANRNNAFVGDVITYTLVVNNPNAHALTNIIISDTLPTGLVYKTGTVKINNTSIDPDKLQQTDSRLSISIADIPANSYTTVTYQVVATSTGSQVNQAYAQSDTANSSKASSTINIIIKPLSLSKSANKSKVKLGNIVHYTLTIDNNNDDIIKNATVNDILPKELSYIADSATINGKKITADTSNTLSFQLGDLAAKTSSTLEYDARVNSNDKSTLTNIATVTANEAAASSNTANASIEVSSDTIILNKSVNKQSTKIGETLVYTIDVTNPQAQALSDLILNDVLPTGFTYNTGTAVVDGSSLPPSQVQVNNQNLDFSIGTLEKNSSIKLSYEITVTDKAALGDATNSVSANSKYATSDSVSSTINVQPKELAIKPLVLSKSANDSRVKLGDIVHYTLAIDNNNDKVIKNATVNDSLPKELSYITDSATINGKKITADTSNGLLFHLGDLVAKTNSTLEYDARVNSSDKSTLTNIATVTANEAAANSNTANASIEISSDTITLDKSVNKQSTKVGEILVYSINVANPQDHALSDLTLNDVLPTGFIYQTGTAKINGVILPASQIQVNDQNLDFNIGTLNKKDNITITYEVTVSDKAIPGDATNVVSAESKYATSRSALSTVKVRTPSTIEFLKITSGTDSGIKDVIPETSFNGSQSGGKQWEPMTEVKLRDGSVVDLSKPQSLSKTDQYTISDPIVIQVTDLDQNTDSNTIQTIIVVVTVPGTNDKEVLQLKETAPNSGIFRGILPTSSSTAEQQNGVLSLAQGSRISVSYFDQEDQKDVSATAALITPDSQIILTKTTDKDSTTIGEYVRYTLTFKNTTDYVIPNLIIKDILPIGFNLEPNTTVLNQKSSVTNINIKGRQLTFSLGKMKVGEQWSLEYLTKVSANVQIGEAINVARIDSNKFTSNYARSKVLVKDDLMRTKNILTGRVYIGCETSGDNVNVLKDARIYLETGRNILSDAEGFWHMEDVNPGKHVVQLDTDSLADDYEPIICTGNTRYAKNTKSRFIDLTAGSLWHVDFHVKKSNKPKTTAIKTVEKLKALNPVTLFDAKYLKTANSDFEILWPKNNYVPAIASTKIYIKSSPKYKVDVYLNGKKVSALNYDGSTTNAARTTTIRHWNGVDIDIKKTNNTLLAILKDKSGKEIARKTHNIHFSSKPASARFLENRSILVADGKTTPVIALQIRDEDGFPMRANTHGYFTLKNSQFTVKAQTTNNGENLNESISGYYKYKIEEGGITYIELNPTTQSGQMQLELKFSKTNKKIITAWLKPQLREWILVGLAEGTVAYKSISGNIKALEDLDKADKYYKHGRIAFFAKGKIKGKYLLTLAYDSHKKKQEAGYQLNGDIDPDSWYTVYADNTQSQYDAPSSRKLYVKLEKNTFYALFGDYRTNLNVTELAKFERTLNGFKSGYKGKNLSYKAFISETSNNHHHDEIPGDGTSGLYHLSNDIIPNSETIRIETRDRFHSERITETRELVRYQDYDIDYDAGTLFFKFPISGRDSDFNPNIIVVDYDSETDSSKNIVAGGRVAVNTTDRRLEVGLSAINLENNIGKDDSLVAIDTTFNINETTKIHAEIAQSKTKNNEYKSTSAQIIEFEKQISNLEAKLYYRKQEDNFGIDAQASELGTKKVGAELKYRINTKTDISAEVSKQNNLSNNNERQLAEVKFNKRFDQFEINTGLRHSKEKLSNKTQTSDMALLGGRYTTKDGKVSLRGNIEKNLNSANESEQSPDRAIVGVDVKLKQGITLFAEHEITKNNSLETQNSRVGVTKDLWKGAKGRTTYTQEHTDQGQRNYATLGLSQNIKLTDKIRADISIDHAKTIGDTQTQFNENEPKTQGSQRDDYTAFSVGLGSNDKDWSWSTRAEIRNGTLTDKQNYRASLIRHLDDGKNLSAKLNYTDSKNSNGDYSTDIKLSLGSAWHPKEKDFIFFSRLDLVDEKSLSTEGTNHTQKIIHNLHYNQKINDKTQLSIHHGIKHIVDSNNSAKSHSTVDTATIALRKDISERWDIGAHAGYLHDWTDDNTSSVAGISVGVTPTKNAWLQFGYNFEGFDDADFDDNDYKRKGVYLSFSYKFDQDSLRRKQHKVKPTKAIQ